MKNQRREQWNSLIANIGGIDDTLMSMNRVKLLDGDITKIKVGAIVNAMHITASVFINDNASRLHRDFERWLEKLAQERDFDFSVQRLDSVCALHIDVMQIKGKRLIRGAN